MMMNICRVMVSWSRVSSNFFLSVYGRLSVRSRLILLLWAIGVCGTLLAVSTESIPVALTTTRCCSTARSRISTEWGSGYSPQSVWLGCGPLDSMPWVSAPVQVRITLRSIR
ncbi:MAG: hypothetical protein [Microviridae sp.]|nr:MAG: hypothetical protein [Microviridae sp.]